MPSGWIQSRRRHHYAQGKFEFTGVTPGTFWPTTHLGRRRQSGRVDDDQGVANGRDTLDAPLGSNRATPRMGGDVWRPALRFAGTLADARTRGDRC